MEPPSGPTHNYPEMTGGKPHPDVGSGDATGSTSCALGPGVIVTRAAPDAFEETPGRGQLPFEQRGNDNLNRANHSDEYKHRQ